jgi:hypothetical protein
MGPSSLHAPSSLTGLPNELLVDVIHLHNHLAFSAQWYPPKKTLLNDKPDAVSFCPYHKVVQDCGLDASHSYWSEFIHQQIRRKRPNK